MSFMYPRTVSFTRPNAQQGEGLVGYGGLSPNNESPVVGAQDWAASIQLTTATKANPNGLPSDARMSTWKILILNFPAGLVNTADICTDDLGRRFQIDGPYTNSLGSNFACTLLEG